MFPRIYFAQTHLDFSPNERDFVMNAFVNRKGEFHRNYSRDHSWFWTYEQYSFMVERIMERTESVYDVAISYELSLIKIDV